ncbi:MAG: hypothetical protein RRY79_06165 [Clostridia bacterium]
MSSVVIVPKSDSPMRSPGNTRLGCTDQIAVPVGDPDGKRSAGNSKQIIADIDILCSRNGIDDLALLGGGENPDSQSGSRHSRSYPPWKIDFPCHLCKKFYVSCHRCHSLVGRK